MPTVVKYANAYLTDRLYGGPEEGGWYYDCGEPIMSLPFICDESEETVTDENGYENTKYVFDNHARDVAFDAVYKLCEAADLNPPEYEFFKRKDWSIDGFAIYIEDKAGEYFPQKRPHWDMGDY